MKKILLLFMSIFSFIYLINTNFTTLAASSKVNNTSFSSWTKNTINNSNNNISTLDLATNPNDGNTSFNEAVKINIGLYGTYSYASEADTDYYYFNCFVSTTYTISISGISSRLYLYEFSNLNAPISSYYDVDEDGINITMTANNTYYMMLSPYSLEAGNYSINLNYTSYENASTFYYSNYTHYYGYKICEASSSRTIYYYIDSSLDTTYNYMTISMKEAFNEAIKMWNALQHITFVETTTKSSADIVVSSYSEDSDKYALTTLSSSWLNRKKVTSSTIEFNTYLMNNSDSMPDDEAAIMIAAHELGHAIGFEHNDTYQSIMTSGAENMCRTFTPSDILTYTYLWGN